MKYRLTPFHFLAALPFTQAIYYFIILAREKGEAGLAGLLPFILLGLTICIVFVDMLMQGLLTKRRKVLFAIEVTLSLVGLTWYYRIGGFN